MTRARVARGRTAASGKPSRNVATVLDRLKPEEAATVLQRLLTTHSDLRAEAGRIANDLFDEVSFEDVACEIEGVARALDLDDLDSRAGSHSSGYKEPTDAAWELLEEVVEPFLDDMKRQAELHSPANALEICKGVVLGLYPVGAAPGRCVARGAPARRSPRRSSKRTSPSGVHSSPRHFHGRELPGDEAKPVGHRPASPDDIRWDACQRPIHQSSRVSQHAGRGRHGVARRGLDCLASPVQAASSAQALSWAHTRLSGGIRQYDRMGMPGVSGIRQHHRLASYSLGSASRAHAATRVDLGGRPGDEILMQEMDLVVLTRDLPDQNLRAGDVGTVVRVHKASAEYEVEFATLGGHTLALLTVLAGDVRPVGDYEIAHARQFA